MHEKSTNCPVCERFEFDYPDDYGICPICGWENDGVQRDDPDYSGGANNLSVNESKIVHNLINNIKKCEETHELLNNYKQRNKEIHIKYRNIDHRTSKGEECINEFRIAHDTFVIQLRKLSTN